MGRRRLLHAGPNRVDLAEELGTTLLLWAATYEGDLRASLHQEVIALLSAYETAGVITPKGVRLLRHARE
jgi:hypothetical protein